MKKFDLNIEKILTNWEIHHAVREIISNALDEQLITGTKDIKIFKQENIWYIRDYGTGLNTGHLTQKEDETKRLNPSVIGKFGIGLKDAFATLERNNIIVRVNSRFTSITLGKFKKNDFDSIETLHAIIEEPLDNQFVGTEFSLEGLSDLEMQKAKNLFLIFNGERTIDSTKYGQIIEKKGTTASIYMNGVNVSEEENFLFSYNISPLKDKIKKELNRERTNVGRTAYTESVQKILVASKNTEVAKLLGEDLINIKKGSYHEEIKWLLIQIHAVKILNETGKYYFPTEAEKDSNHDLLSRDSREPVVVTELLKTKLIYEKDYAGNKICLFEKVIEEYNESFEFTFVEFNDLSQEEQIIFSYTDLILGFIGGKPIQVKKIAISETMRKNVSSEFETSGLWDLSSNTIIIDRKILTSLGSYAAVLIHEAIHAKYGVRDATRSFEYHLTETIGIICEIALQNK